MAIIDDSDLYGFSTCLHLEKTKGQIESSQVQSGPLLVINGLRTPANGLING